MTQLALNQEVSQGASVVTIRTPLQATLAEHTINKTERRGILELSWNNYDGPVGRMGQRNNDIYENRNSEYPTRDLA